MLHKVLHSASIKASGSSRYSWSTSRGNWRRAACTASATQGISRKGLAYAHTGLAPRSTIGTRITSSAAASPASR